jgi:co-chaperonin GroES (HSP10)
MSDLKDLKGKNLGKDKTSDELKFEVHPNLLFAKRLLKDKTEGGIYLPENAQKNSTPIVQLMAIGKRSCTNAGQSGSHIVQACYSIGHVTGSRPVGY